MKFAMSYSCGKDSTLALHRMLAQGAEAVCLVVCFNETVERSYFHGADKLMLHAYCQAVGLSACFPLWREDREALVHELLSLGYSCLIKSLNRRLLPISLLGCCLDAQTLAVMQTAGVDVCGEMGEYHTLVVNGPVFKRSLQFKLGELLEDGDYALVDVQIDR